MRIYNHGDTPVNLHAGTIVAEARALRYLLPATQAAQPSSTLRYPFGAGHQTREVHMAAEEQGLQITIGGRKDAQTLRNPSGRQETDSKEADPATADPSEFTHEPAGFNPEIKLEPYPFPPPPATPEEHRRNTRKQLQFGPELTE